MVVGTEEEEEWSLSRSSFLSRGLSRLDVDREGERRDMGEEGQDGRIGGKTAPGKVRIYHAQNVVVSAVQDGGQDERGKESLCVFKV